MCEWILYYVVGLILIMILLLIWLDLGEGHGFFHDLIDDLWRRAFSSHQRDLSNRTQSILNEHGLVCALLFCMFGIARWFMPTFLLIRPLAKWVFHEKLWDDDKNKSHPRWHDCSYLISLIVLWGIPTVGFPLFYSATCKKYLTVAGCWVLLDIFIYHVNMFWFDELRTWTKQTMKKPAPVWSLRRVSLQAIISYIVSIDVFACFYMLYDKDGVYKSAFVKSINIATLNPTQDWGLIQTPQIFFCLILLIMIISSTTSAMFRRDEMG